MSVYHLLLLCLNFGLTMLFTSCTGLYYQPTQQTYTTPDQYKIEYESLLFRSHFPEENFLHAWYLKNSILKDKPKSTILYFHGNAQNLSAHFLFPAYLTQHGHDVFIFDYRGYGQSQGKPSQKGIHYDALAALRYAYDLHLKSGSERFIVYGHSLGGTIAMRAAVDFPHKESIDLMIIESSFSSYKDLAFDRIKSTIILYPFSPLAYLLFSDSYAAQNRIKELSPVPLLVIHGNQDEIVPVSFGKEIYELAREPKWSWIIPQGGHGGLFHTHPDRDKNREKLLQFLEGNQEGI